MQITNKTDSIKFDMKRGSIERMLKSHTLTQLQGTKISVILNYHAYQQRYIFYAAIGM